MSKPLDINSPNFTEEFMKLPDLTPREHEVAAAECEAIATYFDRLADACDGPSADRLIRQHRNSAEAIRNRGRRHQEKAQGLPRGALEPE